jgi:two-component system response regulator MprA
MAWWDNPHAMSGQARILVVDDDPRIAAAVRRALIYEGYSVETAADGPAALTAARDRVPDLIVLDVMLPGLDGIDVCRRVRAGSDVPILMLTARDAVADRVIGLDSGADDYLVKPFAPEELLARVRTLLRRSRPQRAEALRFADITVDVGAKRVWRNERQVSLTTLEFQLLEHLVRNPELVLSRAQLLDAVWGLDADTTSNVVDVYIGYLRQKLEAAGEPRLLQTVRGFGYVLREE